MTLAALFFYLFACMTVAAGFMVIAARNPVHAVLFLILAFFNAAGLFVLLGAEFLAMILVVVYVGAVAVLFLFVVMMLDVDFAELRAGFMKNAPLGALVGLILLAELVLVVGVRFVNPKALAAPDGADPVGGVRHHQYRSAGARALHQLRLLLPGCGPDPAGGHDRGHRAHPAPQGRRQAAVDRGPGGARQEDGHGDRQAEARRGHRAPVGAGAEGDGIMSGVGLGHYLTVAAILFTLGIFGIFLNRKNVIVILMSVELMLLAVNINLVAFSSFMGDLVGQVFALFVLTVAAGEAAIGLAIVVVYYRNRGSIAVEDINMMKG